MKPRIKHKKRGTVSMANNGDNLHGSQVSCEAPEYFFNIPWEDTYIYNVLPIRPFYF